MSSALLIAAMYTYMIYRVKVVKDRCVLDDNDLFLLLLLLLIETDEASCLLRIRRS